jgi:hypothetical protein
MMGRMMWMDRSRMLCGVALAFWLCLLPAGALGAEPCVLQLDPDAGPSSGGMRVRVRLADRLGSEDIEVRFGERPAKTLSRRGDVLDVEAPPHPPGSVRLHAASTTCAAEGEEPRFTYLPPPRFVSVHPLNSRAAEGDLVLEVTGSGFESGARLLVDGTPVPMDLADGGRWTVAVPAALLSTARHMELRIDDPRTGRSDPVTLTLANPTPRLVGLQAPLLRAGRVRTPFQVHGEDFRPASVVLLDGTPLATRFGSDRELESVLPAEALTKPGRLSIAVATPGPGGGTSNPLELSVLPPPPFGGRFVVFMSNRGGGRNRILLLDRQTGTLDSLKEANSAGAADGYPSISADGRYIAFQSDRHRGQSDILLFDRESRTLDLLPEANDPSAFDGFPSISPDGRFVVFESDRINGKPKIFVFDRETRLLTELSQANEATADDGMAAISN